MPPALTLAPASTPAVLSDSGELPRQASRCVEAHASSTSSTATTGTDEPSYDRPPLTPLTPFGPPPPEYQRQGAAASIPPLANTFFVTPVQTKRLSSFLQVGRVLDMDDFLTLTSAGALAWADTPPPTGVQLEKNGNVSACFEGDSEPPLVRLRHVTIL